MTRSLSQSGQQIDSDLSSRYTRIATNAIQRCTRANAHTATTNSSSASRQPDDFRRANPVYPQCGHLIFVSDDMMIMMGESLTLRRKRERQTLKAKGLNESRLAEDCDRGGAAAVKGSRTVNTRHTAAP